MKRGNLEIHFKKGHANFGKGELLASLRGLLFLEASIINAVLSTLSKPKYMLGVDVTKMKVPQLIS